MWLTARGVGDASPFQLTVSNASDVGVTLNPSTSDGALLGNDAIHRDRQQHEQRGRDLVGLHGRCEQPTAPIKPRR